MVREKRILSYILSWLLLGYIILFIGINNVNADTIDYENIGLVSDYTIFYVTSDNSSGAPIQLEQYQTYSLNNVTQFLLNIDNYTFNKSIIYDLEVHMPINTLKGNISFMVYDSNYNQCITYELHGDENYPRFRFSCPSDTNHISMTIYSESNNYIIDNGNFSWNYTYLRKQVSNIDLGPIIDSNNQNTQDIINSNKETQEIIKDQLNTCRNSVNLFNKNSNDLLNANINYSVSIGSYGEIRASNNAKSLYMKVDPNTTYTISKISSSRFVIGTSTEIPAIGVICNDVLVLDTLTKGTITTGPNDNYIVVYYYLSSSDTLTQQEILDTIQIQKGSIATKYEPYGEQICSNKIDETNKELGDINDALTDSSPTDMSVLGDTAGWLPPGPVDSIINLPLTFFLNLSQSLSSECKPVSLPLPYVKKNIELPCMNSIYEKIGITGIGGFYTWVGLICSAVILFNYLLDLYHWVDKTLTMRENTMPGYYEDKWGGGA